MEQIQVESAQRLKTGIIAQLAWDDRVDASHVQVDVFGTTVRLSGTVPTYKDRHYAGKDALMTAGVTTVDNRLTVQYPNRYVRPADLEIRDNIMNMLTWNANFRAPKIQVWVNDGVVTLEGSVAAFWEKLKAEELVAGTIGVVGITNELAVVPTETFRDEQIAQDIMHALERNTSLNINAVDVMVENGIVSLRGAVPDWLTYHAVENTALYTSGVRSVDNRLLIEGRN